MPSGLTKLEPSLKERIWGTTKLSPLFSDALEKIGEVWFAQGTQAPLLLKFIFTSQHLSVQVHPPDDFAQLHEGSRGKTEMWHVLHAEPGAAVALGLRDRVTRAEFEQALTDHKAEELLQWVPAQAGDSFFVPAGVVHAIGAGLTVCEIQQNSDVTYRLYDYGRPRELHLERGLAVSRFEPHEGRIDLPFRCPYFFANKLVLDRPQTLAPAAGTERVWIVLEGDGAFNNQPYRSGEAWKLDDDCLPVSIAPSARTVLFSTGV